MLRSLLLDAGPTAGPHGLRGIGRYVKGLVAAIEAFPEDMRRSVWASGPPEATIHPFGDRALASPHRMPLPPWMSGRIALGSALRTSRAQVLHATDPQRPWVPRGVPLVVTVYDLIPLREEAMLRSWRLDHQLIYRWYLGQIRNADRVIAISRATAVDLQDRLAITAERIDVIPPIVALPARVERHHPSEPTFVWVGALDPHKEPGLAVRAFARFVTLFGAGRLRFIGPGDDEPRRRLLELAARSGVASRVSQEGHLPDDDLESAYASATALLSTSRIEGFGLPGVEAALRGVPVIAVTNPAAIETLGDVATLVPADPDAIAEAMAKAVPPPVAGLGKIRERFSLGTVSRSLADCYRRMGVGS